MPSYTVKYANSTRVLVAISAHLPDKRVKREMQYEPSVIYLGKIISSQVLVDTNGDVKVTYAVFIPSEITEIEFEAMDLSAITTTNVKGLLIHSVLESNVFANLTEANAFLLANLTSAGYALPV